MIIYSATPTTNIQINLKLHWSSNIIYSRIMAHGPDDREEKYSWLGLVDLTRPSIKGSLTACPNWASAQPIHEYLTSHRISGLIPLQTCPQTHIMRFNMKYSRHSRQRRPYARHFCAYEIWRERTARNLCGHGMRQVNPTFYNVCGITF